MPACCCGRCGADDWDAWREVRLRCREWLERWEPRPEAGQRRSRARPRGVPRPLRRVGAPAPLRRRVRLRAVPRRRPLRGRGEPRQRAARPVPDGLHRLLDRRGARRARVRARRRRAAHAVRVRDAAAAPARGGDRAPQRASRRVAEKLGLRDEGTALRFLQIQGVTRTTSATRSPSRSGTTAATSSSRRFLAPLTHRISCGQRYRASLEPALAERPRLVLDLGGERGARSRAATAPRAASAFDARRAAASGTAAARGGEGARGGRGARRRDGSAHASPISAARGAVDALAEQHHRGRGLRADRALEHPGVAAAGVEADAAGSGCRSGPTSPARRTSQASARFMPAPTAGPLTAAIVGSGERSTRRKPS